MDIDAFITSLKASDPPTGISTGLKALWFAGKGNWEEAHNIVNDLETPFAIRIHAYLHRIEPDPANARYWYNRADITYPACSADQEWNELVRLCLNGKLTD